MTPNTDSAATMDETAASGNADRNKPRRAPAPAALAPLRFAFATMGRVAPGAMAKLAYRLWFKTRRFPLSARERSVLAGANRIQLMHQGQAIAVYSWGEGPTIMFIHGWHGSAANFVEFVEPLTAAGFRVLAVDQPAHGATAGESTNIFEIAGALNAVAREHGPIAAIVTHSFGAACAFVAMESGFSTKRVACISPPASVEGLVEAFAETLALPPKVVARFRATLERDFGRDIWSRLSPARVVPKLSLPALIVHDRKDRAMLFEEGEALARAWSGAEFHPTSGLGHQRILADRGVIARVVKFLKE